MSWSAEELVKYLRLTAGNRTLMRDAADMIDRLRAELEDSIPADHVIDQVARAEEAEALAVAEHAAWQTMADRAEISEAAIARVRELCELAIRDPDSGVGIEDIVNALERNQP